MGQGVGALKMGGWNPLMNHVYVIFDSKMF